MLFDARDVGVRRVVADLVVDVDLVDDRGRELGLVLGDEHDAAAVVGGPDHSIITGTLAVSSRRRSTCAWILRPLAELDETVAVVVVVASSSDR